MKKLKISKKIEKLIAAILAISLVPVFVDLHYIVTVKSYDHGLTYSNKWFVEYKIMYFILCLYVSIPMIFWLRNISVGKDEKTERMRRIEKLIACFILISMYPAFTYFDHFITGKLPNYGLQNPIPVDLFRNYGVIYFLLYEYVIISVSFWQRSIHIFSATEVIMVSNTQDLLYYGLWAGYWPDGPWAWTLHHFLIGSWTTIQQFGASSLAIILIIIISWNRIKPSLSRTMNLLWTKLKP